MTTTTNPIPADLNGLSRPEVVKHFAAGDTVSVKRSKYANPEEGVLVSLDPHIVEVTTNYGGSNGITHDRKVRKASKARRSYHFKAETWNNSSVGFAVKVGDETIVTKMVLGDPKAVRSLVRKDQEAGRQARAEETQRKADERAQNDRIINGLLALGLIDPEYVDEDDNTSVECHRGYRNSSSYEIYADALDALVAKAVAAQ